MKDGVVKQEEIPFILERFFFGWKMGAAMFDAQEHIAFGVGEPWSSGQECVRLSISRLPDTLRLLYEVFLEDCKKADYPVIHMGMDNTYHVAFMDASDHLFIFGPASADSLSFAQQMNCRKHYHISNLKYTVPQVAFAKSLNGISMIYYMLTGRRVTEDDIMRKNFVRESSDVPDVMTYQIQNNVEEKQHLAYKDELRWTHSIENGTLDETLDDRLTPENVERLERVGMFSDAGSLKQCEYMVVTSTCLASRAAIRGGANAYEAYALSEVFLQKISRCTDTMELLKLHMQIANEFSKMVRQAQEGRAADCVEQCKDYIARYRTKKFSLTELAGTIGRNPSYLSRLFSERTGMTMQEYALDLRLEASANLLRYSGRTVGEIAEYLNFPSQSYFGERFRKKYGMSPSAYRKCNKIRDFEK